MSRKTPGEVRARTCGTKSPSRSISWAWLNFRRRPFCTTLYRNLVQASNFGGTFDQLFLRIFFMNFSQKLSLYICYTMVQKKSKMTKNSNQRGGGGPALSGHLLLATEFSCTVFHSKWPVLGDHLRNATSNLDFCINCRIFRLKRPKPRKIVALTPNSLLR